MEEIKSEISSAYFNGASVKIDDNITFCPLVLNFIKEGRQEWRLSIQSKPIPKITLEGRMPTIEEMVDCLQYTNFSISSIPIFMVIADIAWQERQPNPLYDTELNC